MYDNPFCDLCSEYCHVLALLLEGDRRNELGEKEGKPRWHKWLDEIRPSLDALLIFMLLPGSRHA